MADPLRSGLRQILGLALLPSVGSDTPGLGEDLKLACRTQGCDTFRASLETSGSQGTLDKAAFGGAFRQISSFQK